MTLHNPAAEFEESTSVARGFLWALAGSAVWAAFVFVLALVFW